MIQKIVEPDTCKYSMDGITVDTESNYELCFDFEDSKGVTHHINATQLAVIKESFHTMTWDNFVFAHNDYADVHKRYIKYRINMCHELTHGDCSFSQVRELVREFELVAMNDYQAKNARDDARDAWLTKYCNACNACDCPIDYESLFTLGSKWLLIEEKQLDTVPY